MGLPTLRDILTRIGDCGGHLTVSYLHRVIKDHFNH